MLASISCHAGQNESQNMDAFAVQAYVYLMMQDYRSIDSLPREHPERSHENRYDRIGTDGFLGVSDLAPHVEIVDIWEWVTMPNKKMYVLALDDEGQEMIKQWAGSDMSEGWAGLLDVEFKLTIGWRNGEPYLVGF